MADIILTIDLDKIYARKMHIKDIDLIFVRAIDAGIADFTEQLINKLDENLIKYGLGGSALAKTKNIHRTDDGISITMEGEHAMFVEYGTGIVGETSVAHPKPNGWIYDINEYGDKGWWYPTTESDPNPYKWRNEFGSLYAWTAGMPSRPFMYDTWKWATHSVNNTIVKHINRELNKLGSDMR